MSRFGIKKLLCLCLALMLAALPVSGTAGSAALRDGCVGADISGFQSVGFDGEPVDGSIFAEAEVTVINIWQRWCGPCWIEMPYFLRLHEYYSATPEADVKLWGALYYTTEANIGEAIDYVSENGYNWDHMLLPREIADLLSDDGSWEYLRVPQTLIVDSRGVVREQIVGSIDSYDTLYGLVDYWLRITRTEGTGDADGDGEVTAADALLALRCAMDIIRFDEEATFRADMDRDGTVTSADALTILRSVMGLKLASGAPEGAYDEIISFNARLGEMINEYALFDTRDKSAWSTSRIIVGCEGELDTSGSLAHVRGCGRYVIQYASPKEAMAAAERYAALAGVEYAVPDAKVEFDLSMGRYDPERQEPGVDSFKSWGFGEGYMNAYAYNEWLLDSAGGADALPEIIVAVIDSGLEYDHPFFAGRTVPGWDFGDNDGDTGGGFFHGTHVAGTVVDGTLPNVKVMALKCTDDNGVAVTSVIINCIQYAYQHGARVANVSMGGYYPETAAAYTSVINAGADAGMVTCAASGNDSMNVAYCYPACIERALTVAAHDRSFNMWSGSNTGAAVDITAPGVDIVSAMPNGGFQAQTGTSMASPHAAAACAALMSHDPDMSADAVMNAIKSASVDHGLTGGGAGVLCMTALIDQGSFIPGDADGDGTVSSSDALLTLRYAMNIIGEASLILEAADVDGDGVVTSADALLILRKAMGIIA